MPVARYNTITFDGLPVLSPTAVANDLEIAGLPVPAEIWKCNHFTNPLGSPAIGHLLMAGQDLEWLDFNIDTHVLALHTPPFEPVYAYNLIIVPGKTRRIGKGKSSNPNALYIVEIADRRWFGMNPYFACEIRNSQDSANNIFNENQETFNIPTGLYPGEYYSMSRQTISLAGTKADWSWESMAKCLWPAWLGSKPTGNILPYTPHDKPVGFDFTSVNHLEAYNYLMARTNCALRFVAASGTFDVIQLGTVDLALQYALLNLNCKQLNDSEYLGDELLLPGGVTVCFHVESSQPGSENTFAKTSDQWRTNAVYKVERSRRNEEGTADATNISTLMQRIYHTVWDDFVAKMDPFTGSITNLTDVEARADERRDKYFKELADTRQYHHMKFTGAVDLRPGPQVKAVSWREDFEEGGWVTEIINHPAAMYEVSEESGELVAVRGSGQARNKKYESIPEYIYPYETFVGRVEGEPDADGWQAVVERRLNPGDNTLVDGVDFVVKDPNA